MNSMVANLDQNTKEGLKALPSISDIYPVQTKPISLHYLHFAWI